MTADTVRRLLAQMNDENAQQKRNRMPQERLIEDRMTHSITQNAMQDDFPF